MLKILKIPVGLLETNCYLVHADGSRRTVCIDPGDDGLVILEEARDMGLVIEAILLTHGHFDHIGDVGMVGQGKLPVYLHPLDMEMLQDGRKNESIGFGVPEVKCMTSVLPAEEGKGVDAAGLHFDVWHTPGHSKGSVCYLCEDCLFTGDTMFATGYGRTDLYGGSFDEIKNSLKRLIPVRTQYKIFPGHGN